MHVVFKGDLYNNGTIVVLEARWILTFKKWGHPFWEHPFQIDFIYNI